MYDILSCSSLLALGVVPLYVLLVFRVLRGKEEEGKDVDPKEEEEEEDKEEEDEDEDIPFWLFMIPVNESARIILCFFAFYTVVCMRNSELRFPNNLRKFPFLEGGRSVPDSVDLKVVRD